MKKYSLLLGLFFFIFSFSVTATEKDKERLQSRLEKVNQFTATFKQVVTAPDKSVIQHGFGELRVKRPHYFNWHITEPDESFIISDGKTIWMYTPNLDQVIANNLSDYSDNTLLLLISGNDNKMWNNYNVTQKNDIFTLTPKHPNNQQFEIRVLPNGMISNFTIIETDGQRSFYDLSRQDLKSRDDSYFIFKMPKNAMLDDQRKNN